jgi:ferredoxin-NADP reductase/DMSO/TMAO reductase YedYZ heme-binding membrane subunit
VSATTLRPTPERFVAPALTSRYPVARALLVLAVTVGTLLVVGLWWRATDSVAGLGEQLTAAGRLCGLVGTWAVLVVVALIGRIPPLERTLGADRLSRWHAMGGRYGISLLVAHAVLITWGYSVTAHTSYPAEGWTLLRSYPDVLAATVALALLLMVAGVSMRAARTRIRHETWFHLHLYTYLAVALSFAHQLATGSEFVDDLAARVLWSTLYVAVFGSLAWYRVVVPALGFRRHGVRVAEVRPEAPGVVSLLLTGRDLRTLGGESGQFLRLRFLDRTGWWQSHPYSLSAPPHEDVLRVTVKTLGDGSAATSGLRPGTRVWVEGPYGAMTARARTRARVLLVAAGIGISPLRALFETLPAAPGDLTLLYRASTEDDLVLLDELRTIARDRQAELVPLVGHRDSPADLTTQRLRDLVPDVAERDVYLCGPDGFMAVTEQRLRAAGVPTSALHAEHFTL